MFRIPWSLFRYMPPVFCKQIDLCNSIADLYFHTVIRFALEPVEMPEIGIGQSRVENALHIFPLRRNNGRIEFTRDAQPQIAMKGCRNSFHTTPNYDLQHLRPHQCSIGE